MNTLSYKPDIDEVLERLRLLHERKASDRILATMDVPNAALADFRNQYTDGYCDYPDPKTRIAFWNAYWRERATVEDDSVPCAYLSEMDQGLYGGILGGNVQFMSHPRNGWISSMVAPLLSDWSQFDSLRFDRSHPWFERYLTQLQIFVDGAADKFGISHFILIDGLNFVYELVGASKTYMSLFDCPDTVRKAIDLAFDINVAVADAFFDRVPAVAGGTCSNMVGWAPGRIVSESIDPFHMTSVDYFERWGREPVQRILGRYDGGIVHIHGNGRHLLEVATTIRGLKAIWMGDDTGFPLAVDVASELRRRAGDVPLVMQVDFAELGELLERRALPGGILYRVTDVPGIDEANRYMEKVRAYRV